MDRRPSPGPSLDTRGHIFAYVTGVVLLVISVSLLGKKEARLSATLLGFLFLLCTVFLHAQKFPGIIHDGVTRTRAFEAFALAGAAFVLATLVAKESVHCLPDSLVDARASFFGLRYRHSFHRGGPFHRHAPSFAPGLGTPWRNVPSLVPVAPRPARYGAPTQWRRTDQRLRRPRVLRRFVPSGRLLFEEPLNARFPQSLRG